MNLDSLKDFLNNLFENIIYRIKNSVVFNILIEKYEQMDIHHQIWIRTALWGLAGLMVLFIPLLFFMSSMKSVKDFKIKKHLISHLLKSQTSSFSTQDVSDVQWEKKISSIIDQAVLSSSQTVDISPLKSRPQLPRQLISLKYSSKQVKINGVNIKTVVELGQKLGAIAPSIRLVSLKLKEMPDRNNFFHVTYGLIRFHSPDEKTPNIKPIKKSI